ncbi:MAG: hypothetical protein JWR81_2293 [Pseudonocardia sp.]|nr:hypothetical protein [Pseudonocardia sp.]
MSVRGGRPPGRRHQKGTTAPGTCPHGVTRSSTPTSRNSPAGYRSHQGFRFDTEVLSIRTSPSCCRVCLYGIKAPPSAARVAGYAGPATPVTLSPPRAWGGVTVYPAPLLPIDATSSQSPNTSATTARTTRRTRALPGPDTAQRSGELLCGGDLLTARQRQPDRRSDMQAGKEWPARRTTGPAGMNPRREEITTSIERRTEGQLRQGSPAGEACKVWPIRPLSLGLLSRLIL